MAGIRAVLVWGGGINLYGNYMTMIAEIRADYTDGTSQIVKTDDTWKYKRSDVEDSGIYDGEILNRLQNAGGNP